MWINCHIISNNLIIYDKIQDFINKTHFLTLCEENEEKNIIFWDNDSVNINLSYLNEYLLQNSLVIIISSLYTKEYITNSFDNKLLLQIGYMTKTDSYSNFVQEINRLIENLNI